MQEINRDMEEISVTDAEKDLIINLRKEGFQITQFELDGRYSYEIQKHLPIQDRMIIVGKITFEDFDEDYYDEDSKPRITISAHHRFHAELLNISSLTRLDYFRVQEEIYKDLRNFSFRVFEPTCIKVKRQVRFNN